MDNKERKVLTPEERTKLTEKLAMSYYDSYQKKEVKDGATYDDWKFAKDADYWSPYFGKQTIDLGTNPVNVADSATFEALSYSVEFADWGTVDFKCYPTPDGVAWKTHFGGHRKSDGEFMDFFAYSYLDINEYGEITHWETHVNSDYDRFLDVAIGEHGPYDDADNYMKAVYRKLASAGIDLAALMHKRN